jgi:hypothetical protein
MIEIPSELEGKQFDLFELEKKLKPIGYSIGGGWDYDKGFFDYKIANEDGNQYLRLPFFAVDGQLDVRKCTVELGRPFLLSHQYEAGLDDHAHTSVFSGSFNQFAEPENKDASFPEEYIRTGKSLVKELEAVILES